MPMPIYARGPIGHLLESQRTELHPDGKSIGLREAQRKTADRIVSLVAEGKLGFSDINISEAFRELVLEGNDSVNINDARSVSEAITSSEFPRFMSRLAQPTMLQDYEHYMVNAQQLVTEIPGTVNGKHGYYTRLTGGEGLELVEEEKPYETTNFNEYEVTIENNKFGRLINLTREALLYDKTGDVWNHVRNFGFYIGQHRETMIIEAVTGQASSKTGRASTQNFVVNGTGYDIYATTHASVPGSGGYANINWFGDTALSTSGLTTALQKARDIVDINGEYINVKPRFVIVPPALEKTANDLFMQPFDPQAINTSGTGNINLQNVYRGQYTVIVWPALSSSTAWYLGDYPRQTYWQWNWRPRVDVTQDPSLAVNNDIVSTVKASYNGGVGSVDHRFGFLFDSASI